MRKSKSSSPPSAKPYSDMWYRSWRNGSASRTAWSASCNVSRDNSGAPAAALLAQSHLFRELRPRGSIVGRYHWIVRRQAPLLAILIGRHAVACAQMPLERFEFQAIFQTYDVIGID